ncbi:MAG TPA: EthD family reductase [Stellaceae bacterium]
MSGLDRRAALGLGVAAASTLVIGTGTSAEAAQKGTKLTVLYGMPKDPAAFEKYYLGTHMPMVYKIKGIKRVELAKGLPSPDGKPPAFYRITELWFDSPKRMQTVTASPAFQKVVADVPNFASGGATVVPAQIE